MRASLRQDEGADEQGKALVYYLAECVDNGRILLTPYPPEARKKGCMWLKQPIDIYGAFSTAFQFEIKGRAWDRVHGGGDGLALVLQNEGLGAIGGPGNNLGTSDSDNNNFSRGIRDAFAPGRAWLVLPGARQLEEQPA